MVVVSAVGIDRLRTLTSNDIKISALGTSSDFILSINSVVFVIMYLLGSCRLSFSYDFRYFDSLYPGADLWLTIGFICMLGLCIFGSAITAGACFGFILSSPVLLRASLPLDAPPLGSFSSSDNLFL